MYLVLMVCVLFGGKAAPVHSTNFWQKTFDLSTLSLKRKATFLSIFFSGAQGQGHVTQGHEKFAYRFSKLVYTLHLRSATLWVLDKSKSVYFLLELSVAAFENCPTSSWTWYYEFITHSQNQYARWGRRFHLKVLAASFPSWVQFCKVIQSGWI